MDIYIYCVLFIFIWKVQKCDLESAKERKRQKAYNLKTEKEMKTKRKENLKVNSCRIITFRNWQATTIKKRKDRKIFEKLLKIDDVRDKKRILRDEESNSWC